MTPIRIQRGKTIILPISLAFNVAGYEFLGEIRETPNQTSPVIATWDVVFETDGSDGELVATMDNSTTSAIVQSTGWMTLKRIKPGTPELPVFEESVEVEIVN